MYRKLLKISALVVVSLFFLALGLIYVVYLKQDSIIEKAKKSVSNSLNGELEIGGFAFDPFSFPPGLTFALSDILIKDSLYQTHGTPFAKVKRLEVTFGWESLLTMNIAVKSIHIQEGDIFIFKRRDSYSNGSIFKSSNDKKPKGESHLSDIFKKVKKMRMDNVHFTFADSLKEKYYGADMKKVNGSYAATQDGWKATLKGPILVDHLIFNAQKGAFLRDSYIDLTALISFNEKTKELTIHPETYLLLKNGERIDVSGIIATGSPDGDLQMRFQTDRIRVPVATRVLADTIAKKINNIGIDTYVAADVKLRGQLGDKNPGVKVMFKTDTFTYATPVGFFRGLKTQGYFTNQADSLLKPSNPNSEIKTGRITGFFEKVPVKGTLQILDLFDPVARISVHASADSSGVNSLLDTSRYLATNGNINLDLHFNGKLKNLYNEEKYQLEGVLIGKASTRGLAVAYLPRKIKLSKVETDISISHNEVRIHKLDLYDNQNQLFIKGVFSNFLQHLLGSPTPAKAKIDINIPDWKLNWIEVLVAESNKKSQKSSQKFSTLIDQLVDDMEIDANLRAEKLNYHNFHARNVIGKITMTGTSTNINPLSLDAFGGRVTLTGKLDSPFGGNFAVLNASGKINQADVSSILHSFNDFGQKALSSENVKGKLNLGFQFSSYVKPDVSLMPQSMAGHVDLDFTNGQLINFDPFLKIKKIAFKNRPLENVKIAPIRKRFVLKGQEVKIDKIQLETNVLTLFVEGQYSFGPNTDLSIQFPLKNFKKRDDDYEFQHYDAEGLRSIFLRAVEEDGEVNIKLDSRKKARSRNYPDSTNKSKDSSRTKNKD